MSALVVTGTDTGVGKTVVSASLVKALGGDYWKPVQSGLDEATDSEWVAKLTGARIHKEAYRLNLPASPHLAAEDMGQTINPDHLKLPKCERPLIVEGAGGVMVPLNRETFYVDLFARWRAPIVLVARTTLGTINHTTLSVRALRAAGCKLLGVIFNGAPEEPVEQTIVEMCDVRHLGRLSNLPQLNAETLSEALKAIDLHTIRAGL